MAYTFVEKSIHVFFIVIMPSYFVALQKFHILPVDFSIPGGELTPTLKMKRKVVLAKYQDIVADMYKES